MWRQALVLRQSHCRLKKRCKISKELDMYNSGGVMFFVMYDEVVSRLSNARLIDVFAILQGAYVEIYATSASTWLPSCCALQPSTLQASPFPPPQPRCMCLHIHSAIVIAAPTSRMCRFQARRLRMCVCWKHASRESSI